MQAIYIIGFSIAAGFMNAFSSVLQRYEAGQAEAEELFRGQFIKTLTKNPKWIAAFSLQILAYLFQAAALRKGSMIVVEPLLTVELVFMLLILHFFKNLPVGKKEWAAIIMICTGLSGMLISAQPKAGTEPYSLADFALVGSIIAGLILVSIYYVRRSASKSRRAAISGMAAGFSFALVAALTKMVTRQLSHGVVAVFSGWQLWTLLAVGVVSVIMAQNTYGAGPIAVSQPAMMLVEPIASVVIGIYLFGDSVNLNPINLGFALLTGLIAAAGIAMLSHSKRLQIMAV